MVKYIMFQGIYAKIVEKSKYAVFPDKITLTTNFFKMF